VDAKPSVFLDPDTEQYFVEVLAVKYLSFHDYKQSMACILSKEVLKPHHLPLMVEVSILYSLSGATSYVHVVLCLREVNQGRVVEMNALTSTGFESLRTRWYRFVDLGRL
jgi:hypothetical protein